VKGRLFSLAAAVSLGLGVALSIVLATLIVRSLCVEETWAVTRDVRANAHYSYDSFLLSYEKGGLNFQYLTWSGGVPDDVQIEAVPSGWTLHHEVAPSAEYPRSLGRSTLGFSFHWFFGPGKSFGRTVDESLVQLLVPMPLLLLMIGVPCAVVCARIVRRQRRLARQLCVVCGYDLRATPDRCPECGAVPARSTAAA
jgi:hypothetical protein